MKLVEEEFPSAVEWVLDTPHLNIRNHHFYEKLILFDYIKII